MDKIAIIPAILILLVLLAALIRLLSGGRYGIIKKRLVLKSTCSLMFWLFGWVVLWLVKAELVPYVLLMMAGFTLSVAGYVFLVHDSPVAFVGGLSCFLLAQLAYSFSFIGRYGFNSGILIIFAGISLIVFVVVNFSGLFELKKMRLPTNLYLLVISFMLANALGAVLYTHEQGVLSALLTALGALFFYTSDLILAYSIFSPKKHTGLEKPVLIAYYIAQILLAVGMGTFLI